MVARIHYRDSTGGGGGTTPELLLHFDDDVTDASGNGNNGTATGITYATSGAGGSGASGFDKGAVFNAHNTNTDKKVTFDDIDFGSGDLTVEFWWKYTNSSATDGNRQCIMSTTDTTGAGAFSIRVLGDYFYIYEWAGSSMVSSQFTGLYLSGGGSPALTSGTWYHIAFVRSDSQWRLYYGEAGDATGSHAQTLSGKTARQWGGSGSDIHIGQLWDGTGGASTYYLSGELDEFVVTKSAKYTGTGSYDLPTAPESIGGVSVRTWDVSTDEIPGLGTPQTILSKESDGLKPALLGITQIGQKLDPLTRTISTGNLSLTVAGRDVAAGLVPDPTAQAADQTFYRKLVQVYLAHPELTAPGDWLQIFHGYTDDVVAVGGDALEFRCKNFEEIFKDLQWGGSLYEERPITQARTILEYALLQGTIPQSELTLDGAGSGESFSPDNSQIAGTKSWAVSTLFANWDLNTALPYGVTRQGPLMEGFPGMTEGDYQTSSTVSAKAMIDTLLRSYMGSIWINGAGKIVFQAFHTDTDRHFTEDQYQDFQQKSGYTNAINKVVVTQDEAGNVHTMIRKNDASIAKFGERVHECPNFPIMRSYLSQRGYHPTPYIETGSEGALLHGGALLGLTGIKYRPSDFSEFGYLVYAPWSEIIKYDEVTTPPTGGFSFESNQFEVWYFVYNADGSIKWNEETDGGTTYRSPDYLKRPMYASLNVNAMGEDGTPTRTGGLLPREMGFSENERCADVTQWRHYTGKILDRFAAGTPTASVKVDMSNADLEIGDIITLDKPEYSWEGFDDSDVLKWEIVSIEFNPSDDNPGISLDLCAASQSGGEGFTTHIVDTKWVQPYRVATVPKNGSGRTERSATERGAFGLAHGFTPVHNASPGQIEIGRGMIDNGAQRVDLRTVQGRVSTAGLVPSGALTTLDETKFIFSRNDLAADYRYRVYAPDESDQLIIQKLAKSSSDEFAITRQMGIPLCEFTTDGNADPESASLIDLREMNTLIDAAILPTESGGANLGFESWANVNAPPDSWDLSGSPASWSGYFTRYTADAKNGAQCLKVNTADGADLVSKWFKVKGSESRRLSFYHNPTTATSKVTQTIVEIEQRSRTWGALSSVSGAASGASAGTWYRNVSTHTLDSSAAYFRFRVKRSGVSSPVANDAILLDDLSFDKIERHGSKAALDTNLEINKLSTQTVVFNEAVSDTDGALVTSGGNQGLWFAPASGLYRAHWYLAAETCTNHDHYDNRGVELYAKTGNSSGTLSTTLSTTYLQTFGEDGDACAIGTTYTFFRGDVFFEITAGDSFGLQVKEGSNQTFKLFGQTGGPTPGSWMVVEAVQLSD